MKKKLLFVFNPKSGKGLIKEHLVNIVDIMTKAGYKITIYPTQCPAGSTNDFANSLGIPKNMEEAARVAVNGTPFPCDVGGFNGDTFVYVAAFGLFTEVSYQTSQQMKNILGHAAYILEGAKHLMDITSYRMRVSHDGEIIEDEFIYGMVTNSLSVGGFKGISGPDVLLDDGLLR